MQKNPLLRLLLVFSVSVNFYALAAFTVEEQCRMMFEFANTKLTDTSAYISDFIACLNTLHNNGARQFMVIQHIAMALSEASLDEFCKIDFSYNSQMFAYPFDVNSLYSYGKTAIEQRGQYILSKKTPPARLDAQIVRSAQVFFYILPCFFSLPKASILRRSDFAAPLQKFTEEISSSAEFDALLALAQIISSKYKILLGLCDHTEIKAATAKDFPAGQPPRIRSADGAPGSSAPSTHPLELKSLSSRGSSPAGCSDSDGSRQSRITATNAGGLKPLPE